MSWTQAARGPAATGLARWLGHVPRERFLEEFYLTRPFSLAHAGAADVPLLAWETLHRILPRCDPRDVLVVRDGRLWTGPDPASRAEAQAFFRAGHSLVLRKTERYDPGLAALADAFARDLGGAVAVQLYATPRERHSFGWHYDAEEVFILQTAGTKRYFLRENTVYPRPLLEAMPRDMEYEREVSPLLSCTLVPGDWLYIPGGYWHVARALEDSLSISVGVLPPTALDLVGELRSRLAASAAWRGRLPPAGLDAGRAAELAREAERLLGDPGLVARAVAAVEAPR
jgi:ribosomal protein L16 Arg81 hydroxylase